MFSHAKYVNYGSTAQKHLMAHKQKEFNQKLRKIRHAHSASEKASKVSCLDPKII